MEEPWWPWVAMALKRPRPFPSTPQTTAQAGTSSDNLVALVFLSYGTGIDAAANFSVSF